MEITEQARIAAPLSAVWPLLREPEAVVACIPGAQLAPEQGDGIWRGAIRVRFGPTVAAFRGEATMAFDDAAHSCTIEGRGIDQRGASRALAHGTVLAAEEAEGTVLNVTGQFTVTGPLETFANAGGVHVARALLAEFATNMARLVAERGAAAAPAAEPAAAAPVATEAAPGPAEAMAAAAPAPEPPPRPAPPPPAPAKEIGGFSLLWRAFLSWLGSLFGGRRA